MGFAYFRITSTEFIEYAIHTNNKIIHSLAGEVCAQNTSFFRDIDITNENWQAIWFESYKHTQDIRRGIKNFDKKVYSILNLLVSGEGVNLNLLECISTSDGLDILNYPKRGQLWLIINEVIKENILSRISYKIFKNIKNVNFGELEEDLLQYMRSDLFIENNIILTSESLKSKCNILEGLNILTEEKVLRIIKNNKNINFLDALCISELINKNEWENILIYIYNNRENKHYKWILNRCHKNLTLIQKFFLGRNISYSNKIDIVDLIDNQQLPEVFKILKGIVDKENKSMYKRLQDEYLAGVRGIHLIDLCERLKTFVHSLDVD
jgi:glycerol-3-phosphate responsive antiterminator